MGDVERVKTEIDAVALISAYTPLKRTGKAYVGRCPVHDDKTPSVQVSDEGLFHCFGCGVGGDILSF